MYELNYNISFITGTESDDNESRDWTPVERQTRSKTRKITINQERFQQTNSSNRNPSLSRERYEKNPITKPISCKHFILIKGLNSQFYSNLKSCRLLRIF